jgi:hypothetical protein
MAVPSVLCQGGKGGMDAAAKTEFKDLYDKVFKKVQSLQPVFA